MGVNDDGNGFILGQPTEAVCPVLDNEGTLRADDYNGDDVDDILCHRRNGNITILYGKEGKQSHFDLACDKIISVTNQNILKSWNTCIHL